MESVGSNELSWWQFTCIQMWIQMPNIFSKHHRYELSYIWKISERKEILPMIIMVTNNEWEPLWKQGEKLRKCKRRIFSILLTFLILFENVVYNNERFRWAVCRRTATAFVLKCMEEIFQGVGVGITDIFNDTDDVLTESNQENRVKLWCEKPTTATLVNYNSQPLDDYLQ